MSDDQNLHIFYGYVMGCVKATHQQNCPVIGIVLLTKAKEGKSCC